VTPERGLGVGTGAQGPWRRGFGHGAIENVDVRRTALCTIAVAGPGACLALVQPGQLRHGATPEQARRDLPGIGPSPAFRLYGPLSETGDFVMVRLMRAGIKTRAENLAAAHEGAGRRSYPRGGLR
jgi:hypothetical protein